MSDYRDYVQKSLVAVAYDPQPFKVCDRHPPRLAAELAGKPDQLVVVRGEAAESTERFGLIPIRRLLGGDTGQQPSLPFTYRFVGFQYIRPP